MPGITNVGPAFLKLEMECLSIDVYSYVKIPASYSKNKH